MQNTHLSAMDDTGRRLMNTRLSCRSGQSRLVAVRHLLQVGLVEVVVRNPRMRTLQKVE